MKHKLNYLMGAFENRAFVATLSMLTGLQLTESVELNIFIVAVWAIGGITDFVRERRKNRKSKKNMIEVEFVEDNDHE
jgi:hypothetical protein